MYLCCIVQNRNKVTVSTYAVRRSNEILQAKSIFYKHVKIYFSFWDSGVFIPHTSHRCSSYLDSYLFRLVLSLFAGRSEAHLQLRHSPKPCGLIFWCRIIKILLGTFGLQEKKLQNVNLTSGFFSGNWCRLADWSHESCITSDPSGCYNNRHITNMGMGKNITWI